MKKFNHGVIGGFRKSSIKDLRKSLKQKNKQPIKEKPLYEVADADIYESPDDTVDVVVVEETPMCEVLCEPKLYPEMRLS